MQEKKNIKLLVWFRGLVQGPGKIRDESCEYSDQVLLADRMAGKHWRHPLLGRGPSETLEDGCELEWLGGSVGQENAAFEASETS